MKEKFHTNFFTIEAENNFEFGILMGKKFEEFAQKTINENKKAPDWLVQRKRAEQYLLVSSRYFPQYRDELKGYAEGAQVDFLDLWTVSLEDEVYGAVGEKCTTIITNNGKLFSHNEDDREKDLEDNVCLLLKKIGKTTILELYYLNTLGGNAVSINSNGFIVSVNTLHTYKELGIPRNVIARWLSETSNPKTDFSKLESFPRALGFNFNILNKDGNIFTIEYNSKKAVLEQPSSPYVHTNHFLSELKSYELNNGFSGSFERYEVAHSQVKPSLSVSELIDLTNDTSRGNIKSIMNERTIAKIVIDIDNLVAKVWLRRENAMGWVDYNLKQFLGW